MINHDNYILWFIDYADDKLNEGEKSLLRKFLVHNPSLQNEFLDFIEASKLVISADDTAFIHTPSLLKNEDEITAISQNTELDIRSIFEYSEGNLSFEDTILLEEKIQSNPEYAQTLALLEASKIQAESIEYPNKNELKKRVVIPFAFWGSTLKYGAMAAGLALIFWTGYNMNNNADLVVVNKTPNSTEISQLFTLFESASNDKALAMAKERSANQTPTEREITKIVYMPQQEKSMLANLASKESVSVQSKNYFIPTPEIVSPAPTMAQDLQTHLIAATTPSNPSTENGKFSPIKQEHNMSPFEFQLAERDRKSTKFMDVLSTMVTLGGVLDKKDTRMVTEKKDSKGTKKVHFYSKAFEAEFAVKE